MYTVIKITSHTMYELTNPNDPAVVTHPKGSYVRNRDRSTSRSTGNEQKLSYMESLGKKSMSIHPTSSN